MDAFTSRVSRGSRTPAIACIHMARRVRCLAVGIAGFHSPACRRAVLRSASGHRRRSEGARPSGAWLRPEPLAAGGGKRRADRTLAAGDYLRARRACRDGECALSGPGLGSSHLPAELRIGRCRSLSRGATTKPTPRRGKGLVALGPLQKRRLKRRRMRWTSRHVARDGRDGPAGASSRPDCDRRYLPS